MQTTQTTDFQHHKSQPGPNPDRVGDGSVPAAPAGCICKSQIFQILYPNRRYHSAGIRIFFTAERLERCGIAPDVLPRIRVFSPEATAVIVGDLRRFGFVK